MKKEKASMGTTIILMTIAVVTAISIIAAPVPKPVFALVLYSCGTCGGMQTIN